MAEASIPVDLLNPGQVFACLGFMEAAEILLGDVRGGFDWSNENDIRFRIDAAGDECPIATGLRFLEAAEVTSRSAAELQLDTEKWDVRTNQYSSDTPFPFAPPASAATLSAVLTVTEPAHHQHGRTIEITHWGDDRRIAGRDNVKFWAGSGGYPGAALARDAIAVAGKDLADYSADPLNVAAEQSSSFRLDWRRDYIPMDIGFSLNAHSPDRFRTVGYPIVELMAAIGLTHSRPQFHDKLNYRYGVLGTEADGELFDLFYSRAALGACELPFPQRSFHMELGWPGKEGQARCITTVYEEDQHGKN